MGTNVFSDFRGLPDEARGLSVALGNFDGLHIGHMAVVEAARTAGQHRGCNWGLATFEPPPSVYFGRAGPSHRITSPGVRAKIAGELGASAVFELPFGKEIASMTDEEFVERVLVEGLDVSHISVGADFRFGRGRMGDARSLTRICAGLGVGCSVVSPVTEGENASEKVSSSSIRTAIRAGEMDDAAAMLGRWWTVAAEVEHGEKRGRTIGFPTANMRLGEVIEPRHGIYSVMVRLPDEDQWRPGVANFGRTPTTGVRDPLLEVFLFDFDGDLYGKMLEVAFIAFQREEARFDSVQALVDQMKRDELRARKNLENATASLPKPPLPGLRTR